MKDNINTKNEIKKSIILIFFYSIKYHLKQLYKTSKIQNEINNEISFANNT